MRYYYLSFTRRLHRSNPTTSLFELFQAFTLGAQIVFQFPPADAEGFYSKLVAVGETVALVPTIEAREAEATVESDRIRIFDEIRSTIGMESFNSQLQAYLERSLRAGCCGAIWSR